MREQKKIRPEGATSERQELKTSQESASTYFHYSRFSGKLQQLFADLSAFSAALPERAVG